MTRAKSDFGHIYDRPDPRAYFRTLAPLEYQTPEHARRVFGALLAALRRIRGTEEELTVVDLCCSYGINGALLNHRLDLHDLIRHYGSAELTSVSPAELADMDRRYFAATRQADPVRVVGIDIAENAIRYALEVGLLDDGFVEDLECAAPSPALRASVAGCQLITITGGTSYITEKTLQGVVSAVAGPVWVAAFAVRIAPYQRFADALAGYGLVTERHEQTFPQRRFSDAEERRYALEQLARVGIDPSGKESTGYYHAELFLSRPAHEAAELSLADLLGELSGRGATAGGALPTASHVLPRDPRR